MSKRGSILISALALCGACERKADQPEPEGMTPASRERTEEERQRIEQRKAEGQTGTPMASAPTGAAHQLASARCEREQRCGNVGSGQTYSSTPDCINRIAADWHEDLNARACPGGVVEKELAECLEEIRSEDCGAPFDSLERMAACRASDICNAVP